MYVNNTSNFKNINDWSEVSSSQPFSLDLEAKLFSTLDNVGL